MKLDLKRLRIARWLSIAALGFAAVSVGRTLASGAPSKARDGDRTKAERKLTGEEEEKLFVPDGSWVGGQGIVEPADRPTNVAAAVPGRISSVKVKEGDEVRAGDVLVELDREIEAAAVASAKAEVASAKADLDRALHGQRWEDRAAAQAEAEAAAMRSEQSRAILERLRKAQAGGGVTGDEVDRADKQAKQDSASANAAAARRKAADAGSRSEDIAAATARLDGAEARQREAEARLEQRVVRAPIDGQVLAVRVRAGEYFQPGGEALVVLGDMKTIRVRIDVDERDVGAVAIGARTIVRVSAQPGKDLEAKVVDIGRRMGRKNVRSDDPVERNDTKILEVVAELAGAEGLVVGQRVVGFIEKKK